MTSLVAILIKLVSQLKLQWMVKFSWKDKVMKLIQFINHSMHTRNTIKQKLQSMRTPNLHRIVEFQVHFICNSSSQPWLLIENLTVSMSHKIVISYASFCLPNQKMILFFLSYFSINFLHFTFFCYCRESFW